MTSENLVDDCESDVAGLAMVLKNPLLVRGGELTQAAIELLGGSVNHLVTVTTPKQSEAPHKPHPVFAAARARFAQKNNG